MRFCSNPKCKPYPVFSTDKNTGKGYCKSCAPKFRTDLDRRKIMQRAMDRQAKLTSKVRKLALTDTNKELISKMELNKWYDYVASFIKGSPKCMECGDRISESDYRNASAHIFSKALFPSIATHPFNFLVLGCRCGCHEKSHRLDTFSQMEVWPMAVARFIIFQDKIKERHKYLNLFRQYAMETSNMNIPVTTIEQNEQY